MNSQEKTVSTDLLKQESYQPNQGGNPGNQSSGGPQFNLPPEGDQQKGRFREWINRYGSSVILPVVALLILAGGIYLYATQKQQQDSKFSLENAPTNIEETAGTENTEESPIMVIGEEGVEEESQSEEIQEIIPEVRKEEGNIIEKAIPGDGVTHLARRALKDYLADHSQNQELTNQHKIYIEDYLKDQTGSEPLEIGEEVCFSENLIQEAIESSLELNDNQLKNLEKYSSQVIW